MEDYYGVLEIESDATYEEIKRAFQRLALAHHPDKSAGISSASLFRQVHEAWKVLGDEESRAEYDQSLADDDNIGANAEEVLLTEFTLEDQSYQRHCRCGDAYVVSEDDIREGYRMVQCGGCSLIIKIQL